MVVKLYGLFCIVFVGTLLALAWVVANEGTGADRLIAHVGIAALTLVCVALFVAIYGDV